MKMHEVRPDMGRRYFKRLRDVLTSSVGFGLFIVIAIVSSYSNLQAASDDAFAEQSSRMPHHDEDLGLSFTYPVGWSLRKETWPEPESGIETVLTSNDYGLISLTSEETNLQPEQWFSEHRYQFHDEHIKVAGSFSVDGETGLILYQPGTCETAAMLFTIFEHEDRLFKLMYLATGKEVSVAAFESIVQSLSFDSPPKVNTSLVDISALDFDAMNLEVSTCSDDVKQDWTQEVASARKCSNASMYIPTEGTLVAPWACWNAPVCPMYNPSAPDPYFRAPHRGIDIAGGQGAGVTPVYATYSGVVYLYESSAIRLLFDAPFDYLSSYYAHMAAENPYRDYRTVVNGQRVQGGVTQLGTQGFYGLGSASNTHLHISYHNRNSGETPWPTYDPTQFLKANNLAFYSGWKVEGPIVCSSVNACCGCGSNSVASSSGINSLISMMEVQGPPFPSLSSAPSLIEVPNQLPGSQLGSEWPQLEMPTLPLVADSPNDAKVVSQGDNHAATETVLSGFPPSDLLSYSSSTSVNAILVPPTSNSYKLARSVMGMGGGAKTSSSYTLLGTSGQAFTTGLRTSKSYRLYSGYWGDAISTAPATYTPTATVNWTPSPTGTATRPVTLTPTPTGTITIVPVTLTPTPSRTPTLTPPSDLDYGLFLPITLSN